MKMRIFAILFLIVITLSLIPGSVLAQRINCPPDINPGALVPCGGPTCPCTLCDFFDMIARIINFALTRIVPVIAALMLIIAGAMMISAYAGQSGPEVINRAKKLLGALVIGLFIIYLAWVIINMFLVSVGVSEWTGLDNWWTIDCESSGVPEPPIGDTFCGDGIWQPLNSNFETEECDTNSFPIGSSCLFYGFVSSEEVFCNDDCEVDTSPCETGSPGPVCGNGIIEGPPNEVCDCGSNNTCTLEELGGDTCQDWSFAIDPLGNDVFYTGGILGCSESCFIYDFSNCIEATYCGDNEWQFPNDNGEYEECDNSDLNSETCLTQGFQGGGILSCSSGCTFNTESCISETPTFCGDGIMQSPNDDNENEDCDGADLNNETCLTQGFLGDGDLSCYSDCAFNTESCSSEAPTFCGDDTIQNPNDEEVAEVCDGSDLGTTTCASFGLNPGILSCLPDCLGFDPSECGDVIPPEAGELFWNCDFSGAALGQLAAFDPAGNLVWLRGIWSINIIDSKVDNNWYTTCQPGWTGTSVDQGWKDLDDFASTHVDGNYIAFAGYNASYLFFIVESGQVVINQDLCTACPNQENGLCDQAICLDLGSSCRNIPVILSGGPTGNICVAENQCEYCGSVISSGCGEIECNAIGPNCVYNAFEGTCIFQ